MYSLPQAGILAQNLLEEQLNRHGYHQSPTTPGLWRHDWRPISFTPCINNFGIKYVGKEHANHLAKILNEHYVCSIGWTGTRYIGINMDWDYAQRQVHVSILDYVPKALTCFCHCKPRTPQHQPYPHVNSNYGAKAQYTESGNTSPAFPKEGKKFIQEVIGMFLYYAQCVDSNMLAVLGSLATQQANPTKSTMAKVTQFLDYVTTHPDAIVTYHASDMVLSGHSDVSYLSESNTHSRVGGHFFMSNNTAKPPNNGAILTTAQIIKAVMSSAVEAKVGALYINCRGAVPACQTLEFMGHPQPPTPMQAGITTALGVVNNNVLKKLKLMDMKYHWLCDRFFCRQFRHHWATGKENNGNYVTKHHASIHHQATHQTFLTLVTVVRTLQNRLSSLLPAARVC
jgi:hypothetical protein